MFLGSTAPQKIETAATLGEGKATAKAQNNIRRTSASWHFQEFAHAWRDPTLTPIKQVRELCFIFDHDDAPFQKAEALLPKGS